MFKQHITATWTMQRKITKIFVHHNVNPQHYTSEFICNENLSSLCVYEQKQVLSWVLTTNKFLPVCNQYSCDSSMNILRQETSEVSEMSWWTDSQVWLTVYG